MLPNILPDVNSVVRELAEPVPLRLIEVETVSETIARVRGNAAQDRVVYFYVTDAEDRLVGVVPFRRLLFADPGRLIGELMIYPVLSVEEGDSFGSAIAMLAEHRLFALPVVDGEGRLTGVLDVSARTGALVELERRESAAKLFHSLGIRAGRHYSAAILSLAIRLVLAAVTAAFARVLARASAVAFLIPGVLTVATAFATWAVAVSLDTVQWTKRSRVRLRDLVKAVALTASASAVMGVLTGAWTGRPKLGLSVACSLTIAATAGAALGYAVPRIQYRWNLNPKMASGPLVTAIADVIALSCYLAVSSLLIGA